MRRWFKVLRDAEGAWTMNRDSTRREFTEQNIVFVSNCHKGEAVDVFNRVKEVRCIYYFGDGDPTACDGVTQPGQDKHLYHSPDVNHILVSDLQTGLTQGFPDKDGHLGPHQCWTLTLTPPTEFGG